MPRSTSGAARAKRKRRLRKATKGYWGARSKQTKTMITAVIRADASAYRDRRLRKRDYRALWITRISAACQQRDMNYSQFMNGLKRAGIVLDRKMLSQLAINDPPAFDKLVTIARDKTQQQKAA